MGGTYTKIKDGAVIERRAIGLGDAVARIATPIARALKLPCVDPKTKDLRPESGCAKRKKKLNELGRTV
jgi:hypothetical protein